MHNSLFIRKLLKKINNDPLRVKRRNPHRMIAPDPKAKPGPNDFELKGVWTIVHDEAPYSIEAARDVSDFLSCMKIRQSTNSINQIYISTVDNLPARACRLSFKPNKIRIEASDAAGIWAGVTWIEWEMRTRRGPFLPEREVVRKALWPVQISQGPWGGNYAVPDFSEEYLNDDAFRLYAHYGVNRMMIYGDLACYIKSKIFPELNCKDYETNISMLKNAAERALRYGVQFTYLVVGPKLRDNHPLFMTHPNAKGSAIKSRVADYNIHCLCSSDEECLAFYSEVFGNLFTQVPELGGLTLIVGGESFYHCRMWSRATIKCKRCYLKPTEEIVINLADVVTQAVKKVCPTACVAVWPYNTGDWEPSACLELLRKLPITIGYFDQIDKNHLYEKNGYKKKIWDYSVDFIGPSESILERSKIIRKKGNPFFVKTETGIGLEVIQYPYVPCMQRLANKWKVVRRMAPYGVQQSWLFFGMFGSRAEELGLWAAYAPDISRDNFLNALALRDFGPDAASKVINSWQKMSEAVGHIPCICLNYYYIGPSFLGPAHPLFPKKGLKIPDIFKANLFYLQEGEETFSSARHKKVRTSLVMDTLPDTAQQVHIKWQGSGDGWNIIRDEFSQAAQKSKEAWKILFEAREFTSTSNDRKNLEEEMLLSELIYRTFKSCERTIDFLYARKEFEKSGNPCFKDTMLKVAEAEMQNAMDAIHIYDEAPWLDLSQRNDGIFQPCKKMIKEKIRLIRCMLRDFKKEF